MGITLITLSDGVLDDFKELGNTILENSLSVGNSLSQTSFVRLCEESLFVVDFSESVCLNQ